MTLAYGQRLSAVVADRGPLCVGIDPHPSLLRSWGLPADVTGLEKMARGMVAALGEHIAVFKPQSAFYEMYGSKGIAVLERVLVDIKAAGALSLLDVKRGDIGSTMDAYASAYLGNGAPLAADAITVSPYLGFESLNGAIDLALATGRGLYVLALTSNPEGPEVQLARTASGATVGQTMINHIAQRNVGDQLGSLGIVAGATIGQTGTDFSKLNGSILAPGIGAQGGTAADIAAVFGRAAAWVLPSTSREVIAAGPEPQALRAAANRARAQMKAVVGVG